MKTDRRIIFTKKEKLSLIKSQLITWSLLLAYLHVWPITATASGLNPLNRIEKFGLTPIDLVTPSNFKKMMLDENKTKEQIKEFCLTLQEYYKKYGWTDDACNSVPWKANLRSKNGHPLIYAEFGSGKETTLLLGGVHPDEITPIPIAFRVARELNQNPSLVDYNNVRVIIAPLVNPDGFLRNQPSRTNANGIDLNRNFLTFDWYSKAKKLWIERREGQLKHYPGYFPNSEIETIFQIQIIDIYRPDKILSIHAPLGFLDYDGPGDLKKILTPAEKKAKQLVHSISEKSQNYKVVDYTFFPGSLGNYAGNERNIPTVTLELETTDPKKIELYWKQFLPGIMQSIQYPFRTSNRITGGEKRYQSSKDYARLMFFDQ